MMIYYLYASIKSSSSHHLAIVADASGAAGGCYNCHYIHHCLKCRELNGAWFGDATDAVLANYCVALLCEHKIWWK
jgi:hypothetical protein